MRSKDFIDVSGHLEIYKVFDDGREEKVFDDSNTITSGMGVGLGLLYAGSGAGEIPNFQIRYFQLGTRGDSRIDDYGVSETFLASALGQVNGITDYKGTGANSYLPLEQHNLMDWNGAAAVNSLAATGWWFGVVPDSSIKRVDLNSVTYIIWIDKNSCNYPASLSTPAAINEIGLFMQNPLGETTKRSQLVAYRPFSDISKTDDFALVFKWTLNF